MADHTSHIAAGLQRRRGLRPQRHGHGLPRVGPAGFQRRPLPPRPRFPGQGAHGAALQRALVPTGAPYGRVHPRPAEDLACLGATRAAGCPGRALSLQPHAPPLGARSDRRPPARPRSTSPPSAPRCTAWSGNFATESSRTSCSAGNTWTTWCCRIWRSGWRRADRSRDAVDFAVNMLMARRRHGRGTAPRPPQRRRADSASTAPPGPTARSSRCTAGATCPRACTRCP